MRISDWSSDVCSSDLHVDAAVVGDGFRHAVDHLLLVGDVHGDGERVAAGVADFPGDDLRGVDLQVGDHHLAAVRGVALGDALADAAGRAGDRKSNTSELQSLMRISYAVFSLKKK